MTDGRLSKQELVEELNELLGDELTPSEEQELRRLPTVLLVRLKELVGQLVKASPVFTGFRVERAAMIDALTEDTLDSMDREHILRHGFAGYENVSAEALVQAYRDAFEHVLGEDCPGCGVEATKATVDVGACGCGNPLHRIAAGESVEPSNVQDPCERCGKASASVGKDGEEIPYFSDERCNRFGTGVVLCPPCADHLLTVSDARYDNFCDSRS